MTHSSGDYAIFGLSRLINLFEKTLRDGGIWLSLRIELNSFSALAVDGSCVRRVKVKTDLHLIGLFVDFCT